MFQEFKTFATRGNVIDLAVGIIIGAAFTAIVTSLVNDILMPPLGLVLGGIDFGNFFITLKGDSHITLDAAQKAGAVTVNYGVFLNACLKFVIVAFAVFLLVKQVNRFKTAEAAKPPAPSQTDALLGEIRDLLKKP
jgi:large conductance mechanosensitive channel